MHKKYAKDGLAVISVSVDPPEDKDKALTFLQSKGSTFTNLFLDETPEFWTKKLRFIAPPCVYVFNRQGKWTQFDAGQEEIDDAKVEKLVVEYLKGK